MIELLVSKYGKRLYGLCVTLCGNKIDADDLYQDTWLKVISKFEQYDISKNFECWLTKICVNTYRDMLRRQKFNPFFNIFNSNEKKDDAISSVPAAQEEDYTDLHRAIEHLPHKLRTTVILYYFFELNIEETAEATGVPPGTVKSRLAKARQLLKEELGDEYMF